MKKTLLEEFIIHNTYAILCNEIVDKFTPGTIVYITTEDFVTIESKKEGKYQELIQLSTTPDPGYHMGK